jgi:hypothetical protein
MFLLCSLLCGWRLDGLWELDEWRHPSQSLGMTEYEIDWPLLGMILSGTIPITIAAIVAWVAVQQWITAKNKLALDLFDRRFAAWKALDAAFDSLMAKLAQEHEDMVQDPGPVLETMAFVSAESHTRFLFGDDFRKKMEELSTHIFDMRESVEGTMFIPMRRHAVRLRWELEDVAERYMMLKNIGVAKPRFPLTDRFMKFTTAAADAVVRKQE